MKQIQKVLNELQDSKKSLYDTLDDKLSQIQVTIDELEVFKKQLIDKNVSDEKIQEELNRYHILKKLDFVLHEINIHQKLDQAINFLKESYDYLSTL